VAAGVRCAEVTFTSNGISNFLRISKLASMTGKSESEPIRIATKGLLIILTISVKDAQITETYLSAQSSILIEEGY
jgi:hypothetical protein